MPDKLSNPGQTQLSTILFKYLILARIKKHCVFVADKLLAENMTRVLARDQMIFTRFCPRCANYGNKGFRSCSHSSHRQDIYWQHYLSQSERAFPSNISTVHKNTRLRTRRKLPEKDFKDLYTDDMPWMATYTHCVHAQSASKTPPRTKTSH